MPRSPPSGRMLSARPHLQGGEGVEEPQLPLRKEWLLSPLPFLRPSASALLLRLVLEAPWAGGLGWELYFAPGETLVFPLKQKDA